MSTNVDDYTDLELYAVLGLSVNANNQDVLNKTNYYISKYEKTNSEFAVFFKRIQMRLCNHIDPTHMMEDDHTNEHLEVEEGFTNMNFDNAYEWMSDQYLKQNDPTQANKITDRVQKIKTFDNAHVPMKQEQIATTDTYEVPVKQDTLNPNLKNTITRFINLDSQFRQYNGGTQMSSTNYVLDLSDMLRNVVKLSLYSFQIPFSWYTIDVNYGNTCFWIQDTSPSQTNSYIRVNIQPGNYTASSFVSSVNDAFFNAGFTFPSRSKPPYDVSLNENTPAYINPINGKLTLYLYDGSYNGAQGGTPFIIDETTKIIFYDFNMNTTCGTTCSSLSFLNNCLGWLMGFRNPYENVIELGNTAPAILDLTGTKYLILSVDDFNQNHINNCLVSITQQSNVNKMPSYYSTDTPYLCISPEQNDDPNSLENLMDELELEQKIQIHSIQNGYLVASKYNPKFLPRQVVLPSAPRTLTRAQLHTINAINSSNNNVTNYLSRAPTTSDILAILPVKTSVGVQIGSLLVEFSGSLKDNCRTYFGPVNIERMAIKLLDDKGNVLNLNGNDWCVTLIAECLYQY